MANLLDLQFNLSESVEEISSLPTEHWECWIVQLLMDLDKKASDKGQGDDFQKMLSTVHNDITARLASGRW